MTRINWKTRVGIDMHIRDNYYVVARVPIVLLLLMALLTLTAAGALARFVWTPAR